MFLGENAFLQSMKVIFVKKSKILLKGCSKGKKVAYKSSGQYIHK